MRGLMKYDLMQICSGIKGAFVALYLILLAVLNVFSSDGNLFSYIVVFISAIFGIAAFSYEEADHWNRYKAALPVSNSQIVLARYGMLGICMAVGIIASLALGAISGVAGTMELAMTDWLLSLVQCVIVAVLYLEIMIPVMYRFGSERGRIIMLLLFLIFFGALCGIGSIAYEWERLVTVYTSTLFMAGVAAVLLPVSISASIRIQAKKEY
ncbi:MAG: ABC-2 transporter permease [Eubacteriales bacterium]|nr:ABC-2 transporter permease [Eubacteriales bacterium]